MLVYALREMIVSRRACRLGGTVVELQAHLIESVGVRAGMQYAPQAAVAALECC